MSDRQLSIIILILSCFLCFVFGLGLGGVAGKSGNQAEKEILELNIELTKLRIKELKEANNG